jgi:hypothetical protein
VPDAFTWRHWVEELTRPEIVRPEAIRFCIVVALIVVGPEIVIVAFGLPMVIPVAVEVPIEMVLEAVSMATAEVPIMLVPLTVNAANAVPAESARMPKTIPTMRGQVKVLSPDEFMLLGN